MKNTFDLRITFTLIIGLNACRTPAYDHVHVTSPDGKFRLELDIKNFQPV
jgi:hypothetical protein